MMSERAAFQSCLSEFMVLVEEMERVEVVSVDEVDEVVDKTVDRDEEEEENGDEDELQSSSEEYKSARASFGSYLEDKGRHVPINVSQWEFPSQDLVH